MDTAKAVAVPAVVDMADLQGIMGSTASTTSFSEDTQAMLAQRSGP